MLDVDYELNFGKYKGCKLLHVPLSYLEWLSDTHIINRSFDSAVMDIVNRYLKIRYDELIKLEGRRMNQTFARG